MAIKQDFTKHLESQIAVWQAQIAEHQERLKQAGAQAKADYDKGVTEVQARAEEAGAKAKADTRPPSSSCRRARRRPASSWGKSASRASMPGPTCRPPPARRSSSCRRVGPTR